METLVLSSLIPAREPVFRPVFPFRALNYFAPNIPSFALEVINTSAEPEAPEQLERPHWGESKPLLEVLQYQPSLALFAMEHCGVCLVHFSGEGGHGASCSVC